MASRKKARTEDIPSSSTPAPPLVTFINMHNLQELAHNRPIIPMEHFLEQVAWPEAQLPLVRPNGATALEPTLV
ncbi:hypothetical protein JHK85_000803 [Glycine max]|nr:hypothetical protein JHK85_000803 [Glycine max]